MPEAPYDEFVYGRHQSGWTPVCEEPAASPANTAYVRASYGAPGGWYPLEQFLTIYAPLISPFFGGTPRAPHPPANDASTQIATTQFVRDNAGSGGGGGIEDVPAQNGAYARTRSGGATGWTDFATMRVAGLDSPQFAGAPTAPTPDVGDLSDRLATAYYVARDFVPRAGGQMSGALITRDGGTATNPGLAIGDNSTGFYRTGANLLVTSVSGAIVMQLMPNLGAFFVPLNVGGNRVQSVGDATADTDALNRQSGDARYMTRAGGVLTGTLTTQPGTGNNDLGLAIGDGATGFMRDGAGPGAGLTVMVSQFPLFMLTGAREAVVNGPLSVGGNRIFNVGDATAPEDALNRKTGDARYVTLQNGGIIAGPVQLLQAPIMPTDAVTKAYVDGVAGGARAPAVIYDLVADRIIPSTGAWTEITRVPFTLPSRGGMSQIMVTVDCNLSGVDNVQGIGVRIGSGYPERQVFAFGPGAGAGESSGFSVHLYSQVSGTSMNIPVELRVFNIGTPVKDVTVLGGGSGVASRTQICVIDLGPVA
jgi:hypothetical protein